MLLFIYFFIFFAEYLFFFLNRNGKGARKDSPFLVSHASFEIRANSPSGRFEEAFDKKRTGGKRGGGEKGKRGSCLWGCGLEDRKSAAAWFLRKGKSSDAPSSPFFFFFLSPHASGGSSCRHLSLSRSLHPAHRNVPCPQSQHGAFLLFLSSSFDLFLLPPPFDLLSAGYSCCAEWSAVVGKPSDPSRGLLLVCRSGAVALVPPPGTPRRSDH